MYVKSWIDFNTNDELTVMQEKIFKSIFINIRLKSHNISCGTWYRSPTNDTTENDSFLRTLKDCVRKYRKTILAILLEILTTILLIMITRL